MERKKKEKREGRPLNSIPNIIILSSAFTLKYRMMDGRYLTAIQAVAAAMMMETVLADPPCTRFDE